MTPRERVSKALNHQQPDRVPLDLWSKGGGLLNTAYRNLCKHLGIEVESKPYRPGQPSAYYDERILDRLGTDVRHVFMGQPTDLPAKRIAENKIINEWGVTIQIEKDTSAPIDPPLANATIEDLDKYPWPKPDRPGRLEGLKQRIEYLWNETDYAIAYRPLTPIDYGPFELSWTLRGMENFLLDMAINPDFVHRLLQKVVDVQIKFYELALDIVGPYVQMVQMGDDYGTQVGPIFSVKMFREIIKPYVAQLIRAIKKKAPNAKIYFHSCGSVRAFLDDLIEIGVDVLQPVQPNAAGMDSFELKRDFGDRLSFAGGIDVQGTLQKSRADVEREVKQRIDAFAPGGGYIFAPANNIPGDVPPENIVYMYELARSYSAT